MGFWRIPRERVGISRNRKGCAVRTLQSERKRHETHSSDARHAQEQCQERGAAEEEVRIAIRHGTKETAKQGRELCRYNFPFNQHWQGTHYSIKQVAPVIKEEANEIVVITVYTFFF